MKVFNCTVGILVNDELEWMWNEAAYGCFKMVYRYFPGRFHQLPITVAARCKAWTVFARSNTGVVGSNPIRGMDVCVRLLCVDKGLAAGWSPVQGVLPTSVYIKKLKKRPRPNRGL
jgi:hypothetical protein